MLTPALSLNVDKFALELESAGVSQGLGIEIVILLGWGFVDVDMIRPTKLKKFK